MADPTVRIGLSLVLAETVLATIDHAASEHGDDLDGYDMPHRARQLLRQELHRLRDARELVHTAITEARA